MDVATVVDLVLVVLAIEAAALAVMMRRDPRWPRLGAWLPNLGAGLCLVLAVRSVAAGEPVAVLGGLLALAGACHTVDLVSRIRR